MKAEDLGMINKTLTIAIDFDGTCTTHAYPDIGEDVGAVPVIKKIKEAGHNIILWTMRDEKELQEAVNWFEDNGIELFGVNRNPHQAWSCSPKAYAHFYIDDAAVGCPLLHDEGIRPYVDWGAIEELMVKWGVI